MHLGTVQYIFHYPLKSAHGNTMDRIRVTEAGLAGDRAYALIDRETGKIVSAKRPKLWRKMLLLSIRHAADETGIVVIFPDGRTETSNSNGLVVALSDYLGRPVELVTARTKGMQLDRSRPDEILAHGPDSDGIMDVNTIALATPGHGFQDLAPVHLVTTSTLKALASDAEPEDLSGIRYRPNFVISVEEMPAFAENNWVDRCMTLGSVKLRIMSPTPRCAIPTLAHGTESQLRPEVLRTINRLNRATIEGEGALPCVGVYAQVVGIGNVEAGDAVTLT